MTGGWAAYVCLVDEVIAEGRDEGGMSRIKRRLVRCHTTCFDMTKMLLPDGRPYPYALRSIFFFFSFFSACLSLSTPAWSWLCIDQGLEGRLDSKTAPIYTRTCKIYTHTYIQNQDI